MNNMNFIKDEKDIEKITALSSLVVNKSKEASNLLCDDEILE